MQRKALIYCRVSSERQKNEGHGLDSQEHRCRLYAKQKGYEVERVFRDSFTGGGDFMNRPAMAELLRYLETHAHDSYVVIFDDLKRFARDTIFHIKLRREFKALGAKVECPNFTFEETDEGEFIETVLAAQGQLERKQNRRQVIQKQKARLERGYWPFYPPPGYKGVKDPVHGKLLVPSEKANLLKEALEGFATGRFQHQIDVQKFLQVNNYQKARMYLETTKKLLRRVIYAGYIEFPQWQVTRRKGYHQPLISLETYQLIQDKLDGKVKAWKRQKMRADFPLRGFAVCAHCGKPFTSNFSKGRLKYYAFYRCNQRGCEVYGKSIPKDDIEGRFKQLLKKIKPARQTLSLTQTLFKREWDKRLERQKTLANAGRRELSEIQDELRRLGKRASKTESDTVAGQYEKQIEDLANKELILKEKLEKVEVFIAKADFETALNDVFSVLKNPYSVWLTDDFAKQRVVLRTVFDEPLAYDKNSGFETAILSLPLRVFQLSSTDTSTGVEMRRIELRCRRDSMNDSTICSYF